MVDTDVVAAALLGEHGRGAEAARLIAGASELAAPSHWRAELANVVWKAARAGRLRDDSVLPVLDMADALEIDSVDCQLLWRGAVARAIAAGHPVYDTLFVELAVRRDLPLATYDARLRSAFPDIAIAPTDLLAG